jgi:hypothetical protein
MAIRNKPIFVPPGGFQGQAQQSLAVQQLLRKKRTTKKRRKKAKRQGVGARAPGQTRTRRKTARKKAAPARLVKGSAAAKRHMANLRKMRKR